MMEHVEQNQVGKAAADKGQLVTVADHVEPAIGKEVGADGVRQMRFEIADAGSDFKDASGDFGIDQADDPVIEPGIDLAQQGFVLPGAEVALDFRLVLDERRAHAGSIPKYVFSAAA